MSPSPRLIFLAHAVAPGRAGAEALVNAELLRALAACWPGGVTVISGGGMPVLDDGTPVASLPGWRVHALGECGASGGSLLSRAAEAGVRSIRGGGPGSIPARLVERAVFRRTGQGLKAVSWTRAAARVLARELEPGAVVYSRALPFSSLAAANAVRARFPWIVNVNDPLPPEVWPGQYAVDPWADRKMREGLKSMLPRIGGLTFPSEQLREVEVKAFPEMARKPFEIVRHVAGPAQEPLPPLPGGEGTLHVAFAGTLRQDRCRRELAEALAGAGEDVLVSFYVPHPMPAVADYAAGLPVRTRVVVGLADGELRRELARADVLLDLESEVDRPLLMTKMAGYSAYGKPVWAFCAEGGTTWELLDGWGYRSALGRPAPELARIREDWRAGGLGERSPSQSVRDLFSAGTQARALLRLVERVA